MLCIKDVECGGLERCVVSSERGRVQGERLLWDKYRDGECSLSEEVRDGASSMQGGGGGSSL